MKEVFIQILNLFIPAAGKKEAKSIKIFFYIVIAIIIFNIIYYQYFEQII